MSLDTSLLETGDTLGSFDFALDEAKFAPDIDKLAEETAEFTLNCTFVNVELASVTAKSAIVRPEKAENVTILALLTTTAIFEEAEPCAILMTLEAEIEACCSCWEKVALSAIIVLEISTVAALTEGVIRFEQS